ncbi:unnamed protein product [Haemonchus placei]|uniref:Uncharacterized protein n=1 Tax=Haemonchus placei TaxID=6290 RepID=A0A3P7YYG1_HAEPC|nr:unnamed protein product [Haemonchus placei]
MVRGCCGSARESRKKFIGYLVTVIRKEVKAVQSVFSSIRFLVVRSAFMSQRKKEWDGKVFCRKKRRSMVLYGGELARSVYSTLLLRFIFFKPCTALLRSTHTDFNSFSYVTHVILKSGFRCRFHTSWKETSFLKKMIRCCAERASPRSSGVPIAAHVVHG